ncbi:MAG: ATP synthase F1 subunit gamma [Candidatus Omnitrophica bacterium]|nr:ATP synthase F1 subunit gamma [Candidatus Omnitrophota bacterium]MDD5027052.1 ATP synthase F1 subunit gamma [Candidatus Omnitrophota bacterium]MDD5662136.1 ATP synthase F1 subunit gamma [Candidatus Omnitrophota bacterium]
MIQSLKTIKNRIRSIENTKKVTAAMELISVAKLNRIEKGLLNFRPYVTGLGNIMHNLISSSPQTRHIFLEERSGLDKICLCVITSDSGLCGVYNNNIIRLAEEFIRQQGKEKIILVCLGRKGFNYFRRQGLQVANAYLGVNGRYSEKLCLELNNRLKDIFISKAAPKVYIAYTHFKTALVHKPSVEKFLNLERLTQNQKDYITEPGVDTILNELIPKYIYMKLKLAILESFTAEHSARIIAMKSATDNAKDLLEKLTLLRNKTRQANITQEIMEIISSTEALKG